MGQEAAVEGQLEGCAPEELLFLLAEYRGQVRARLEVAEQLLARTEGVDVASREGAAAVSLLARLAAHLRDSDRSAGALVAALGSRYSEAETVDSAYSEAAIFRRPAPRRDSRARQVHAKT